MTTRSRADSKGMYSWWWDSHISPKNSKWLQENLTDMDVKVKQMIKLLEEDADSFARRAEMYYKKRPELMKLVEEFYRAYRALAERYDHATGVLRQAHRTMAEAFPNQVPFVLSDDSPIASTNEADPWTPEMLPARALFDPEELQKDALGLSPPLKGGKRNGGVFTDEPNSVTNRRGLKQLNEIFGSGEAINQLRFGEGRARKGLNFQDLEENERKVKKNRDAEAEVSALKEALAKLEAEKEAGLLQYQQSLDKLSRLEAEVSRAQEDSTRLNGRASKAEAEAHYLKEALNKLETQCEASLLQYQRCLDEVSSLESNILNIQKDAEELTDRASEVENEAESMKQSLASVEAEKEAAVVQYTESLSMIANLEEKLLHAEESFRNYNELADKAEGELIILKQALAKLSEEKDAAALQYEECMEKISNLEHKISCAQEEAERLYREIDDGVSKLINAEAKCLLLERSNMSLQSELESLVLKMGSQSQELTENQKELGRLWTCIQDEHLRFVEAETAFQTLQDLHSQTEEELRSLASELQNRMQNLKNLEIQNQGLVVEVQEIKKENNNLSELNMSSALSIKNLQDEVSRMREKIGKLEAEVELRISERNALQQEIYCLKEEINDLNKKNGAILEQVESVGYNPECFGSSVRELQDENSRMKDMYEIERSEKVALFEKLSILEALVEKNAFLENSISDMNVDLEEMREKAKMLEESCQSLLGEKSILSCEKVALTSQLQITTGNLEKLSENHVLLENSLADTIAELEQLKVIARNLKDSNQLLDKEKSGLIIEKESLLYQLDTSHKTLEDLKQRYTESLEENSALGFERDSAFCEIEKLKASLDAEKKAHSSFTEFSEKRLASVVLQMRLLQEECDHWKKVYEEEIDKAVNSQFGIFVLQNCMKDMKGYNSSLLFEYQKLFEAYGLSKEVISELERDNMQRERQVKSFIEQNKILRMGLQQLLRTLDINACRGHDVESEEDQALLDHIFMKVQEIRNSSREICDEYHQLVIEKLIAFKFLEQLKIEASDILMERNTLDQELRNQSELNSMLQGKMEKLMELNEEMRMKVIEGNHKEEALRIEMEDVCKKLQNLEEKYHTLHAENCKALEEKMYLTKEILGLRNENHELEEVNIDMFGEKIYESQLSCIYKDIVTENLEELRKLNKCMDELQFTNNDLEERMKVLGGKLEDEKTKNLELMKSLEKSKFEILEVEKAFSFTKDKKSDLEKMMEQLSAKCDELLVINEEQKKSIDKISSDKDFLAKETEFLHEENRKMDMELKKLHDEAEKNINREESLTSELQMKENEVQSWETQAATLFGELQVSAVSEFFYKGKIHELTEACETLLDRSNAKDNEIELLKDRISISEQDYGRTRTQLAAYAPAIQSLKDSITSLEKHTIFSSKQQKVDTQERKDSGFASLQQPESCQQPYDDQVHYDGSVELQDLHMRILRIKVAFEEYERQTALERLNGDAKIEKIMKEIEEVKSRNGWLQESRHVTKDNTKLPGRDNFNRLHSKSEISEAGNEVRTKDILLDQISDRSSYDISSRRDTAGAGDQMLGLWESADQDGNTDQMVGRIPKLTRSSTEYHQVTRKKNGKYLSSESVVEKELGVDQLKIAKRFSDIHQEENKRRILERLDSDAQKLANLQITVQDLKKKMEVTEKSKIEKHGEYDIVKGQVEEAEEAINKLFEMNNKLMKNVQDGFMSSDGASTGQEENEGIQSRRISEQARRGSEKIGRLQLELKKLQFLLIKLGDERESRGKSKVYERSPRVILRDYLYGGRRTRQKHKTVKFCACVRSPTRGD